MASEHLAIFRGKQIRPAIHHNKWWFSVIDVVGVLADSVNPRDYWFKMKIRVKNDDGIELSTNCRQLKLEAPDGKMRETDCANTETLFRIIQSIPSPKAEPFKRWLARVGYERVQEIEDPELATKRTRALYKAKGFPQNKQVAREGGAIAGNARHQLEQKSGQKVSTPKNYLKTYQNPKLPKG